mmetsp:Transcript_14304/g.30948  ORF Transcript_14304/g.30948 Transcript_14304/m.30948 type:complete len:423 (-) Transcript_14304:473-1741(-)
MRIRDVCLLLTVLPLVLWLHARQVVADSGDEQDHADKEVDMVEFIGKYDDVNGVEKSFFTNRLTPPLVDNSTIEIVATLPNVPGKVAVERSTGRVFFTFHSYGKPTAKEGKINELLDDGSFVPFPSLEFQDTIHSAASVCVDNIRGWLFILDNDEFGERQASIIVVDLKPGKIIHQYQIPTSVANKATFADMIVGPRSQFLFLADTGIKHASPAIVVVDVHVWKSWRVLEKHESVAAHDVVPLINNEDPIDLPWKFGVSSLSLDMNKKRLIYGSMFSDMLYSVPLKALQRPPPELTSEEQFRANYIEVIEAQIDTLGPKTVSESLAIDHERGVLYITDFEHSAISIVETRESWSTITLVQDAKLLRWPSGLSVGKDHLYISCSAIHKVIEGEHKERAAPFHIVRVPLYDPSGPPAEQHHDEL